MVPCLAPTASWCLRCKMTHQWDDANGLFYWVHPSRTLHLLHSSGPFACKSVQRLLQLPMCCLDWWYPNWLAVRGTTCQPFCRRHVAGSCQQVLDVWEMGHVFRSNQWHNFSPVPLLCIRVKGWDHSDLICLSSFIKKCLVVPLGE